MEYQVTITETLSRREIVEASSAQKAEEYIRRRYSDSDIILNDIHFVGVDFAVENACPATLPQWQSNMGTGTCPHFCILKSDI